MKFAITLIVTASLGYLIVWWIAHASSAADVPMGLLAFLVGSVAGWVVMTVNS